jgi:hypothetical protein
MIKIKDLLKEAIDIYSPGELNSKGIDYDIETESAKRFEVKLKYKDAYYRLQITPLFTPIPVVSFGNTDENYDNPNFGGELINSPYSSRILAAIFGLIRYWIDKYNIQQFEYGVEGKVRTTLYDYYFTKHFPDFESTQEMDGSLLVYTWKKIQ